MEREELSLEQLRKKHYDILVDTRALDYFEKCEFLEDTKLAYRGKEQEFYKQYNEFLGAILDVLETEKNRLWNIHWRGIENNKKLGGLVNAYDDFMTKSVYVKQDMGTLVKSNKQRQFQPKVLQL